MALSLTSQGTTLPRDYHRKLLCKCVWCVLACYLSIMCTSAFSHVCIHEKMYAYMRKCTGAHNVKRRSCDHFEGSAWLKVT